MLYLVLKAAHVIGVVVVLVAGVGTALAGGIPILGTGRILWSIVLFSISGLAFMFRLAPLHARLADLARTGAESGQLDQPAYHALSRRWELWGLVATASPVLALLLMILKPSLPAL